MRIGIFSNAHSAYAGGGVLYLSGWARTLREFGSVDLLFPTQISAQSLLDACGLDMDGVSVAQVQRRGWMGIQQMKAERAYDLILRQALTIPRLTVCRQAVLVT